MFYLMIVYSSVRTARDSIMKKLFINHQYEIISNDENYCFINKQEFPNGYLTMYPLENTDLRHYLNKGYSLVIDNVVVDNCPTCNHVNGHHTMCPENITNSDGYTYRVSQK